MIYRTSKLFDKQVLESEDGTEFVLNGKRFVRKTEYGQVYLILSEHANDPSYSPSEDIEYENKGSKNYGPTYCEFSDYIRNREYKIDGETIPFGRNISLERYIRNISRNKFYKLGKKPEEKTKGRRFKKARGYYRKYLQVWESVHPMNCNEELNPNVTDEELELIGESRRKTAREILGNVIRGRYKITVKRLMSARRNHCLALVPKKFVEDLLPENFPDTESREDHVYLSKVCLYDNVRKKYIRYECRNCRYEVEDWDSKWIYVAYFWKEVFRH